MGYALIQTFFLERGRRKGSEGLPLIYTIIPKFLCMGKYDYIKLRIGIWAVVSSIQLNSDL